MTSGFALRPYQKEAISHAAAYGRKGFKRALEVLPTGCGKTVIFCAMAKMAHKKVLVLAHREELLKQTVEKIHETDPSLTATLEQANNRMDSEAKVVVASVQTLARSPSRLQSLPSKDFSLVILDEAHHATARSYIDILTHFGLMPDFRSISTPEGMTKREWNQAAAELTADWPGPGANAPFLCGFTATPHRTDGQGLEAVFDEIVYEKDMIDMMREGWLCPVRGERVGTGEDISKVRKQGGDYAVGELSEAVNTEDRNQLAVEAYGEHAAGRSTIVFAVDVEHAIQLTTTFRESGYDAEYVIGAKGRMERDREDIIREFRNGELPILVNCLVLSEGFDAPECSCIIMARPTSSSLLYQQFIGRGMRPKKGEFSDLLVIDMVDVGRKAGATTINTLFGLPPNIAPGYLLSTLDAYEELAEDQMITDDMFDEAESLEDLEMKSKAFDPLAMARLPRGMVSDYSWVKTGFGFALSIPNGPQLGIVENLLGQGILKIKFKGRPPQQLGVFGGPLIAMETADSYVASNYQESINIIRKNARWRRDEPSQKQLDTCKKVGIEVKDGMTKGDVSILLDLRFNGKR